MIQIRQATVDDVPALVPLVGYWAFEGMAGFEPSRICAAPPAPC